MFIAIMPVYNCYVHLLLLHMFPFIVNTTITYVYCYNACLQPLCTCTTIMHIYYLLCNYLACLELILCMFTTITNIMHVYFYYACLLPVM